VDVSIAFELHTFIGLKEPDFPGGLIPNHSLQGTGEWAYGITDWWEMGFYTPYADPVDDEFIVTLAPTDDRADLHVHRVSENCGIA
jgi:hypothetical protein